MSLSFRSLLGDVDYLFGGDEETRLILSAVISNNRDWSSTGRHHRSSIPHDPCSWPGQETRPDDIWNWVSCSHGLHQVHSRGSIKLRQLFDKCCGCFVLLGMFAGSRVMNFLDCLVFFSWACGYSPAAVISWDNSVRYLTKSSIIFCTIAQPKSK